MILDTIHYVLLNSLLNKKYFDFSKSSKSECDDLVTLFKIIKKKFYLGTFKNKILGHFASATRQS